MAVPVGNFRVSLLLVLKGAVTLAIFVWIANTLSRLIDQRLRVFGSLTPAVQVLAAKLVRMTLLTLGVVLALGSIGIDLTAFAVFSGAVGVGVGFGLQKVVSNLISGVILLMDRSIKPGDVIEIDGTYGSVIALNARYASVQTRDGKEYLIPNEDLITVLAWLSPPDGWRLVPSMRLAATPPASKPCGRRIWPSPAKRRCRRGRGIDLLRHAQCIEWG
jgi:small-conductance mechanosensitive channel